MRSVKQYIQELIYNLNVPSRWGTQTPFTNLTFDWVCPEDLREQVPVIGGKEMPFTYGDLQVEMDMINRAYIEVMTTGDAKGRVFTFPIPTYNMTPDFPWESENADAAVRDDRQVRPALFPELHQFRAQAQHGPLDVLPPAARPARTAQARQRPVRLAPSRPARSAWSPSTARAWATSTRATRQALLRRLDELLEIGKNSLEIKRKVIQRHMDAGLFPYTKRYLGTLRNHFSTLGVNGINEMIRNFTRDEHDITTEWGHAFRGAPARPRARPHARLPGRNRPHVQPGSHAGRRHHLPLRQGGPQALPRHPAGRHQGHALLHQLLATAGGLHRRSVRGAGAAGRTAAQIHRRHRAAPLHDRAHLQSRKPARRWCAARWRRFRLPYITITPTFSICPKHGYLDGEHKFCPKCDQERLAEKRNKKLTAA